MRPRTADGHARNGSQSRRMKIAPVGPSNLCYNGPMPLPSKIGPFNLYPSSAALSQPLHRTESDDQTKNANFSASTSHQFKSHHKNIAPGDIGGGLSRDELLQLMMLQKAQRQKDEQNHTQSLAHTVSSPYTDSVHSTPSHPHSSTFSPARPASAAAVLQYPLRSAPVAQVATEPHFYYHRSSSRVPSVPPASTSASASPLPHDVFFIRANVRPTSDRPQTAPRPPAAFRPAAPDAPITPAYPNHVQSHSGLSPPVLPDSNVTPSPRTKRFMAQQAKIELDMPPLPLAPATAASLAPTAVQQVISTITFQPSRTPSRAVFTPASSSLSSSSVSISSELSTEETEDAFWSSWMKSGSGISSNGLSFGDMIRRLQGLFALKAYSALLHSLVTTPASLLVPGLAKPHLSVVDIASWLEIAPLPLLQHVLASFVASGRSFVCVDNLSRALAQSVDMLLHRWRRSQEEQGKSIVPMAPKWNDFLNQYVKPKVEQLQQMEKDMKEQQLNNIRMELPKNFYSIPTANDSDSLTSPVRYQKPKETISPIRVVVQSQTYSPPSHLLSNPTEDQMYALASARYSSTVEEKESITELSQQQPAQQLLQRELQIQSEQHRQREKALQEEIRTLKQQLYLTPNASSYTTNNEDEDEATITFGASARSYKAATPAAVTRSTAPTTNVGSVDFYPADKLFNEVSQAHQPVEESAQVVDKDESAEQLTLTPPLPVEVEPTEAEVSAESAAVVEVPIEEITSVDTALDVACASTPSEQSLATSEPERDYVIELSGSPNHSFKSARPISPPRILPSGAGRESLYSSESASESTTAATTKDSEEDGEIFHPRRRPSNSAPRSLRKPSVDSVGDLSESPRNQQHAAATKIQAVYRGTAVRKAKKATTPPPVASPPAQNASPVPGEESTSVTQDSGHPQMVINVFASPAAPPSATSIDDIPQLHTSALPTFLLSPSATERKKFSYNTPSAEGPSTLLSPRTPIVDLNHRRPLELHTAQVAADGSPAAAAATAETHHPSMEEFQKQHLENRGRARSLKLQDLLKENGITARVEEESEKEASELRIEDAAHIRTNDAIRKYMRSSLIMFQNKAIPSPLGLNAASPVSDMYQISAAAPSPLAGETPSETSGAVASIRFAHHSHRRFHLDLTMSPKASATHKRDLSSLPTASPLAATSDATPAASMENLTIPGNPAAAESEPLFPSLSNDQMDYILALSESPVCAVQHLAYLHELQNSFEEFGDVIDAVLHLESTRLAQRKYLISALSYPHCTLFTDTIDPVEAGAHDLDRLVMSCDGQVEWLEWAIRLLDSYGWKEASFASLCETLSALHEESMDQQDAAIDALTDENEEPAKLISSELDLEPRMLTEEEVKKFILRLFSQQQIAVMTSFICSHPYGNPKLQRRPLPEDAPTWTSQPVTYPLRTIRQFIRSNRTFEDADQIFNAVQEQSNANEALKLFVEAKRELSAAIASHATADEVLDEPGEVTDPQQAPAATLQVPQSHERELSVDIAGLDEHPDDHPPISTRNPHENVTPEAEAPGSVESVEPVVPAPGNADAEHQSTLSPAAHADSATDEQEMKTPTPTEQNTVPPAEATVSSTSTGTAVKQPEDLADNSVPSSSAVPAESANLEAESSLHVDASVSRGPSIAEPLLPVSPSEEQIVEVNKSASQEQNSNSTREGSEQPQVANIDTAAATKDHVQDENISPASPVPMIHIDSSAAEPHNHSSATSEQNSENEALSPSTSSPIDLSNPIIFTAPYGRLAPIPGSPSVPVSPLAKSRAVSADSTDSPDLTMRRKSSIKPIGEGVADTTTADEPLALTELSLGDTAAAIVLTPAATADSGSPAKEPKQENHIKDVPKDILKEDAKDVIVAEATPNPVSNLPTEAVPLLAVEAAPQPSPAGRDAKLPNPTTPPTNNIHVTLNRPTCSLCHHSESSIRCDSCESSLCDICDAELHSAAKLHTHHRSAMTTSINVPPTPSHTCQVCRVCEAVAHCESCALDLCTDGHCDQVVHSAAGLHAHTRHALPNRHYVPQHASSTSRRNSLTQNLVPA